MKSSEPSLLEFCEQPRNIFWQLRTITPLAKKEYFWSKKAENEHN